jgi:branched-chain amino acid transport system ATP-binding protein
MATDLSQLETASASEIAARTGLHAESVSVKYGGIVANDNLTVDAAPGQIVGLIGPNGAGKTTFIDALTGFAPCSGTIEISGRRIDGLAPHRRQRAGLARTWQAGELFTSLTVLDNLRVARDGGGFGLFKPGRGRGTASDDAAMAALRVVGIEDCAQRSPGDLSLGQQRLVGVARSIVSNPEVLLLDEPAAGLDSRESEALGERLTEVAASGIATLLIDHDINLVFKICHVIYVLDFGRMIASGTPAEVRSNPAVVSAYLGAATSIEEAP